MGVQYSFEWDPKKARTNLRKHGVSFKQAAGVMQDPMAVSIYDDVYSTRDEDRWITLGLAAGDLLVVAHTFHEVSRDEVLVRIISARPATRRERRQYEAGR